MRKRSGRSTRKQRFILLGAAVVAALAATSAAWSADSATRPTKPILKINAQVRRIIGSGGGGVIPVKVFFLPPTINVGTVRIVVHNTDPDVPHQVSINGVYSAWMGPHGGTAVMKVTFKRPGIYIAGTVGGMEPLGPESGGEGELKVLK
jgi:hypothetical protein